MAARTLTPASVPTTYAELRRGVEAALLEGQRAIERAKVLTYHETGRLINAHVLANQPRAEYGSQVVTRLARDRKADRSTLYQCTLFARFFPIVGARRKLTWAHYRRLVQIDDAPVRNALAAEAEAKDWPSRVLHDRVIALTSGETTVSPTTPDSGSGAAPNRLAPQRGTPGLHLVVERGDGLAVDLGFKLYWPLTPDQSKRFAKGDIVRIAADDGLRRTEGASKADLFTYATALRRVVDGDTLVVALEVSPGVLLEQKLRLRGLDCPEMSTPEGRAAKRFVDALAAKTTAVVINTTKPDKYDRYLADVFLATDTGEIFLNNALLENGQAVRKDAWEFGYWEPELIK
jgi:endonuclease YncB( thermonuclease family)